MRESYLVSALDYTNTVVKYNKVEVFIVIKILHTYSVRQKKQKSKNTRYNVRIDNNDQKKDSTYS